MHDVVWRQSLRDRNNESTRLLTTCSVTIMFGHSVKLDAVTGSQNQLHTAVDEIYLALEDQQDLLAGVTVFHPRLTGIQTGKREEEDLTAGIGFAEISDFIAITQFGTTSVDSAQFIVPEHTDRLAFSFRHEKL